MGVTLRSDPLISIVISTYNRRDVLLQTLSRLHSAWPETEELEILVVDNASGDGTARAVEEHFPEVRLFANERNLGACAKNIALAEARGQYVVFLDDDSYPASDALQRMLWHFQDNPELGAAIFTITLPDGSRECSAYPNVFIGCGTGFRRAALEQVGGLPDDFFMQAEEYDLSLRLLDAGWDIRSFPDLHVTHLKTPGARSSERTTRLDVRNNLVLITRYFPLTWVVPYTCSWMRRYWMIAKAKNHRSAYLRGLLEGLFRSTIPANRRAVHPDTFERFAKIEETRRRLQRFKDEFGLRNILLIDCGKNILAYCLAARDCGLRVVAIADPRLASSTTTYRGIRIVDDETARHLIFDAAIVSNLSPVHAENRTAQWQAMDSRPILDLFTPERPEMESLPLRQAV